jgi:hypothetical protein
MGNVRKSYWGGHEVSYFNFRPTALQGPAVTILDVRAHGGFVPLAVTDVALRFPAPGTYTRAVDYLPWTAPQKAACRTVIAA